MGAGSGDGVPGGSCTVEKSPRIKTIGDLYSTSSGAIVGGRVAVELSSISVLRMIARGADEWMRKQKLLVEAGLVEEVGTGKRYWYYPWRVAHKFKMTERGDAVLRKANELENKLETARASVITERDSTTFEAALEQVRRGNRVGGAYSNVGIGSGSQD